MRDATPYAATLLAYIAFAQSNVVILSLISTQLRWWESSHRYRPHPGVSRASSPSSINLAIVPASSRVYGQDDPDALPAPDDGIAADPAASSPARARYCSSRSPNRCSA